MAVKTDRRNDGNTEPAEIKYHSGFVSGLDILRRKYLEAIRIYHEEMNLMTSEIIGKIMPRFSLDKEEAEKYVEEVLGLQLA